MTQKAVVKRAMSDSVVQVSLLRQVECSMNCNSCGGCAQPPKEEILALANNPIGAKPGDRVEVESITGSSIGIAVIVYLLPCIMLLVGYLVAKTFGLGEMGAIGIGFASLLIGFVPAYLLNRVIVKRNAPEFKLTGFME